MKIVIIFLMVFTVPTFAKNLVSTEKVGNETLKLEQSLPVKAEQHLILDFVIDYRVDIKLSIDAKVKKDTARNVLGYKYTLEIDFGEEDFSIDVYQKIPSFFSKDELAAMDYVSVGDTKKPFYLVKTEQNIFFVKKYFLNIPENYMSESSNIWMKHIAAREQPLLNAIHVMLLTWCQIKIRNIEKKKPLRVHTDKVIAEFKKVIKRRKAQKEKNKVAKS